MMELYIISEFANGTKSVFGLKDGIDGAVFSSAEHPMCTEDNLSTICSPQRSVHLTMPRSSDCTCHPRCIQTLQFATFSI